MKSESGCAICKDREHETLECDLLKDNCLDTRSADEEIKLLVKASNELEIAKTDALTKLGQLDNPLGDAIPRGTTITSPLQIEGGGNQFQLGIAAPLYRASSQDEILDSTHWLIQSPVLV